MNGSEVNPVEAAKIGASLVFLFACLGATVHLAKQKIIGAKGTITLLMGMIAVMAYLLGVVIDWKKLTVSQPPDGNHSGSEDHKFSYGLEIRTIHFDHRYLANRDFRGNIRFKVRNASSVNVANLPPAELGWFGANIKYKRDLKLYGSAVGFYQLRFSRFSEDRETVKYVNGGDKEVTYYSFSPSISPPLQPGRELEYSVLIETEGTEQLAFTDEGTFAGMGSPLVASKVSSEIVAPEDYMFLSKGYILRDSAGSAIESKEVGGGPQFSEDSGRITWEVSNPIPTVNYLVRIVLAKRQR